MFFRWEVEYEVAAGGWGSEVWYAGVFLGRGRVGGEYTEPVAMV